MNCIGHIQHGMWTHPRDRSTAYNTIEYWQDPARLAERGEFDEIFLADIVGVYDVYRGGPAPSITDVVQIPVNDPMMVVPVMAAVTEHIGFGVTANLTYEPPYLFARRMSTLDHLTRGRIGWNMVTGYLDSAARGRCMSASLPVSEPVSPSNRAVAPAFRNCSSTPLPPPFWSFSGEAVSCDGIQRHDSHAPDREDGRQAAFTVTGIKNSIEIAKARLGFFARGVAAAVNSCTGKLGEIPSASSCSVILSKRSDRADAARSPLTSESHSSHPAQTSGNDRRLTSPWRDRGLGRARHSCQG
jgi:hypothetical protein